MKRLLTLALIALTAVCSLSACGGGSELSRVAKAVGVDLSSGTLVDFEDTHGGFHGDGHTSAVVELARPEETLADAPGWKPLPMSENTDRAVGMIGWEGAAVEEGFYYFYDRHSESRDPYDDAELCNRASWNFTAAVYDSRSGRLYFYQLDT